MRLRHFALSLLFLLCCSLPAWAVSVTIQSFTIPDYRFAGSTCKLRLYSSDNWTDSTGVPHFAGTADATTGWYQEIACTVTGTTVTIPTFQTPSTTDSIDKPMVRITASLFDSTNRFRQRVFTSWRFPSIPTSYTWLQIVGVNASKPKPLGDHYATVEQVITLIQEGASGGLNKATTVAEGTVRVSTNPVDPAHPTAVEISDPRLPTQGENDALAGTSGTPSSSNKFITEGDVSNAAGSGKVVRANGTALPNLTLNANNVTSGTLGDARLSANVPLLNRDFQAFTGFQTTIGPAFNTPINQTNFFEDNLRVTLWRNSGQAKAMRTSLFTAHLEGTAVLSNTIGGTGISSLNRLSAIEATAWADDSAVVPWVIGIAAQGSNHNSSGLNQVGDLAAAYFDADVPRLTDRAYGVIITASNGTAATTAYGLKIDGVASITNPFGIYVNGQWPNYFGGFVGSGTVTPRRQIDSLSTADAQLRLTYTDSSLYSDFRVDSGGNLNISPTGSFIFNTTGKHIDPSTNYSENLGQLNKKYLTVHTAELWSETLVAQNTLATIGGRILVGPTSPLIADLAPATTTINVKYNNLANGDRVYMEANNSVEFMAITSTATAIFGGYSYTVTRNLDGSGANQWYAGDAIFNTGAPGSGFIDLYSVRGVASGSEIGPTIVGNIRNSTTFNDWSEHWAIGNLQGLYGYASATPGIGLGEYEAGKTHITIDSTNGYRIFSGLSTVIGQWDAAGIITVGQVAASQSNIQISSGQLKLRNNTTTRIQLDTDGSGFLANNLISWDASGNFNVSGNAVIGGFSIGTDYLRDNANSFGLASTVTGGDDIRFWAGAAFASRASAPFRLSEAGVLTSTSANITGSLTAGGGLALADANGFSVRAGTAYAGPSSYKSVDASSGNILSEWYDFTFSGVHTTDFRSKIVTGATTTVSFSSDAPAAQFSNVSLIAREDGVAVARVTVSDASGVEFATNTNVVRMTIGNAGNVKIAGTATRGTTEGTNHLDIFDGTAPVGTLANGISLYSASGELRVLDAAGNSTLLSPHDDVTNEWIFFSKNTVTGKVLRIDMERLMRALNEKLGGGFIQEYMEPIQ